MTDPRISAAARVLVRAATHSANPIAGLAGLAAEARDIVWPALLEEANKLWADLLQNGSKPRNEEITQIENDLAVTRRRAAQLLKEVQDGSPEFQTEMRKLRAQILIQRARLYEAQSEATELKNAQLRGETVLRKEVHAQGAAFSRRHKFRHIRMGEQSAGTACRPL